MSSSSIVWLSLAVYVAGALVTWKIMYNMVYGAIYSIMADCRDCVSRAGSIEVGESHGCIIHKSQYQNALPKVGWATALWPIFGLLIGFGALIYYAVVGLGHAIERIGFPRGNRNKGFLAWQTALTREQYTKTEERLRRELRILGITDSRWFSDTGYDGRGSADLESASREELSRRLAQVTAQLSQAKAITGLNVPKDDKRKAIQSIMDNRLSI